jgi:hypothetical protein
VVAMQDQGISRWYEANDLLSKMPLITMQTVRNF